MMQPTKSKSSILTGFSIIILILIGMFLSLVVYIKKGKEQLQQLTTLNRAGVLVQEMRQSATQRNVILLRMVMNADPFYRDEQSLEFFKQGEYFLLAREEFEQIQREAFILKTAINSQYLM